MVRKKEYFEITIEELQSLGQWAADCAERALSIYECVARKDLRPRNAINGIRDFAQSGKRTKHLRKLAMDAYRASLETKEPAASAAAIAMRVFPTPPTPSNVNRRQSGLVKCCSICANSAARPMKGVDCGGKFTIFELRITKVRSVVVPARNS